MGWEIGRLDRTSGRKKGIDNQSNHYFIARRLLVLQSSAARGLRWGRSRNRQTPDPAARPAIKYICQVTIALLRWSTSANVAVTNFKLHQMRDTPTMTADDNLKLPPLRLDASFSEKGMHEFSWNSHTLQSVTLLGPTIIFKIELTTGTCASKKQKDL